MTLLRPAVGFVSFARRLAHTILLGGVPIPMEFIDVPLDKMPQFEQLSNELFELEETQLDVFKPSVLSNSRQNSKKAAYGGLIFAQALAATERTVDDSMRPHSTHSYFILNVDTTQPLEYRVRRIRDGRSFCTREVDAVQNGKAAFSMQISFHKPEPQSIIHQSEMPKVPPPENCIGFRKAIPFLKQKIESGELSPTDSVRKRIQGYDSIVYTSDTDLFEMRPTDIEAYYGISKDARPKMCFWMRTRGDLSSQDSKLHRHLIAYNTDSVLVGTAVRPHYAHNFHPSMLFSLDHNIWFHSPDMRADEWLLYETESSIARDARAFITGRLWTRDGTLLLSTAQEAIIRTRQEPSRI
ncbi:hypothetical protein WR25_24503 [Diploscapter pachys]|uniref:Acyl-CoA thioesterase II domain-containing protein n=1 Tax=Diploscapter pachys TaxID=2018661 RepID=A0A2A2L874_9BILA|nr:hypothetical protein WR25_24503 [Diploscapter pachys]